MVEVVSESKNVNIVSLGGSLIVPDEIDKDFLRDFIDFIKRKVAEGQRFIIATGGGKLCRRYQEAAKYLGVNSTEKNDWIGIYATRFNGELIRILFGDLAHDELVIDPTRPPLSARPVLIAAGWKPGWSTDYDSVILAREFKTQRIVNLTNIDYVYDKDPKQFADAKKIEKISWQEYRELIPKKWGPGLHAPFDPVASKLAADLQIQVAIVDGKNLENLSDYFSGKGFKGTVIG